MPDYERGAAREWTREHLVGCSSVTIPTFTADLKRLNEAAVAHDVALGDRARLHLHAARHGDEHHAGGERADYGDRARRRRRRAMRLFFHAAFGTLEDNIEAVRLAEREGADLALLSYPPQFWPTTEQRGLRLHEGVLRRDRRSG